jgi:hypothetical protein
MSDPLGPGDPRNALLRQLYREGRTLEETGNQLNLTRERVRQLLEDVGLNNSGRGKRRTDWLVETEGALVRETFLRLRDDTQVAAALGLKVNEVKSVVDELVPHAGVLRARPQAYQPNYADDELIASLRAAAEELSSPLSHDDYNGWAAQHPMSDGRPRPSHQTVGLRWGSWRAALMQAGLPARPRGGPTSALSRRAVIAAVVHSWRDLDKAPTTAEYERWAAGHPDRPSLASARKFVDGWGDARVSAWEVIYGVELPRTDLPELPATEPDPEEPEDIQGLFDGRLSGKVGETRNPYGQQPEPAGAPYRRADEQADPAPAELAAPNVEAVRAAFSAHARLQNAVADAVARAGLRALSPIGAPAFDIAWRRFDGRVVICEVKSAEPDRLEDQMRAAVAQALRYQALAEHKLGEQVDACIFIEREPDAIWLALCQRLGLAVAWAPDADRLI